MIFRFRKMSGCCVATHICPSPSQSTPDWGKVHTIAFCHIMRPEVWNPGAGEAFLSVWLADSSPISVHTRPVCVGRENKPPDSPYTDELFVFLST